MKKRIISCLVCLCMVLGLMPATAWASKEHSHFLCGEGSCTQVGHTQETSTATFEKAISQDAMGRLYIDGEEWTTRQGYYVSNFLPAGTYYLASDIELEGCLEVGSASAVTICLNGHNIIGGSGSFAILIRKDCALTLTDCKNTGKVTHNAETTGCGVYVQSEGTFLMYAGSITENTVTSTALQGGGVCMDSDANFTMYGGSIKKNNVRNAGAGVAVSEGSNFTMYGGSISENGSNVIIGGGVSLLSRATFTMHGGSITGNVSSRGGAAVHAPAGSSFTMHGGSITGNNTKNEGGAVYVESSSVKISGQAEIKDNVQGGTKNSNTGLYEKGTEGKTRNVYLTSGKTIEIDITGLQSGAYIGVTLGNEQLEPGSVKVATGAENGDEKYFSKDNSTDADHTYFMYSDNCVFYVVPKADQQAPTGLGVEADKKNTGKGKITGTTSAMEYHTSANATEGWIACSDGDTQVSPGTYYVRYKEQTNYNVSTATGPLTVQKHTHTGGQATCQKKAVCEDCTEEYGELASHDYIENTDKTHRKSGATCKNKAVYYKSCSYCGLESSVTFESGELDYTNHVGKTYTKNQKDANCYEEGYTGDIYCDSCHHEITKGTPISKGVHNPADSWSSDEKNHWHTCQTNGCGAKIDDAPHKGGEATCTKQAECSECKEKYGTTNDSNHKNTEVKGTKAETCCEAGYTGDTWCKDCNTCIETGRELPATGKHTDVDGKWETDGSNHWHTCYFGTKFDVTAHKGGEATCTKQAECSECKEKYGTTNGSNHKNTEVRGAKAETCCEAGYTGDTWCKDCETCVETGRELPATGKHTDADGKWETDGSNHWHTCYFGTKFDVTAHKGGEATCTKQAECSECKEKYGTTNGSNHKNTEVRGAKAETCCEAGYTGDTWCKDCNTCIETGRELPATGKHTDADGKWETDGSNHWHTCYFGTKFDISAHGGKATGANEAICTVCQTPFVIADSSDHQNTEVRGAKDPTCCEAGYTGDTWCKDCNTCIETGRELLATGKHTDADGKWETDGSNHWHTCYFGTKYDVTVHSGGEATCTSPAICSVCESEYGIVDSSNHKHTELRNEKTATETEKGYTGDTWCMDCNQIIKKGSEIHMHKHQLSLVEAKEATATKPGNIKYYHCDKCDKCFEDAEGTKEIRIEDTVLKENTPANKGDNHAGKDNSAVKNDKDDKNVKKADTGSGKQTTNTASTTKATGIRSGAPKTEDYSPVATWSLTLLLSVVVVAMTIVVFKKEELQ